MKTQIKHCQLLSLFVLVLLSACNTRRSSRDCPISELLLNATDFPAGTIVNDVSSPVAEYPEESADVTASKNQDLILHLVGRYPSTKIAKNIYDQNLNIRFRVESSGQAWEKPAEITFHSAIANQYNTACNLFLMGSIPRRSAAKSSCGVAIFDTPPACGGVIHFMEKRNVE